MKKFITFLSIGLLFALCPDVGLVEANDIAPPTVATLVADHPSYIAIATADISAIAAPYLTGQHTTICDYTAVEAVPIALSPEVDAVLYSINSQDYQVMALQNLLPAETPLLWPTVRSRFNNYGSPPFLYNRMARRGQPWTNYRSTGP